VNKILLLICFLFTSCGTQKVALPHLHNYPYLDGCPSLEARSIDNEELLKAKAKALNMRYVDYLHALSNKKMLRTLYPNNNLTTAE
jgi:hypothetical protein